MARRRSAASDSPQPAKRVKVGGGAAKEDGENAVGGQAGAEKKTRTPSPRAPTQRAASEKASEKTPEKTSEKAPKKALAAKKTAAEKDPSPPRRNIRRTAASKAAAVTSAMAVEDAIAGLDVPSRDIIHERVFAPITDEEREQWKGWTDIESEPAFFNVILNELGVRDATIQEVFAVDMVSLEYMPNALGFIFLYKFVEEDHSEERLDAPPQLWFANQTTANACATLAMLNIAMNCPQLSLAPDLARFQAETAGLGPALRGHLLNTNDGIRAAHNTFARRLDMLASDLALKLEWSEAQKKKKRATAKAASSKKKKAGKRGLAEDDAAFHFIAYVPVGDDVWELNGMQEKPLKLGTVRGQGRGEAAANNPQNDWTAMARERIEARMLAYAEFEDMAMFNLLALCHTPKEETGDEGDKGVNGVSSGLGDEDALRAAARQRDYTPVVHAWIKKLADKGLLRQLATGDGEGDADGGGEGRGEATAGVAVEG